MRPSLLSLTSETPACPAQMAAVEGPEVPTESSYTGKGKESSAGRLDFGAAELGGAIATTATVSRSRFGDFPRAS